MWSVDTVVLVFVDGILIGQQHKSMPFIVKEEISI